jgi:hypothetical protein
MKHEGVPAAKPAGLASGLATGRATEYFLPREFDTA